ncbi:chaperonin GroL [Synechococcus sp. PCC 7335]|uniref:chaperonin GroEL n=1 Tax=Synechococcus sp. (strain ATCC 29403 / PCC 7335) TaxID=91464 RepID=UPI00017ECB53|nr:chaperonin GroEL [Synechococcus sp. PCC 7335]EDX83057.1 chaperonin GroL [Synechococcus sp. PCC 7335]
MPKAILHSDEARRALEVGIDILAEAVAVTLGPRGRNVVIESKFGAPEIINDGVTIAKSIELENHLENTGVSLIRQAAAKTNDVAGDGTTTAVVLARAMIKEGLRNVAAGASAIALRSGIEKATDFVVGRVKLHAQPVQDNQAIAQVATISAGNDATIGEMIATAMKEVSRDGAITLEEGKSMTTELEITEGMQFKRGYLSPYFVTDSERMEVVLEDPYILLVEAKVTRIQDLLPTLELVIKTGKPLLIVADEIEKDALATLVINHLKGVLKVAAVKAPGVGSNRKEILQDIAILTNAELISEETSMTLDQVTLEMLGEARRATLTQENTTIVADGNEEAISGRCAQISRQIDRTESEYEQSQLQERLMKLSGGVAVIKVGAATETEMKDRKYKLEDAINATKAAVEEGIVPGGGATLAHIAPQLETWARDNLTEEELVGAMIVVRSLYAPLHRITTNAGQKGDVMVERVKEQPFEVGYDAIADQFVDMLESGIVDPAKVTRSALQNAASVAAMTLTTECIVAEQPEHEEKIPIGMAGQVAY